jgi:hypothetical protein
MLGLPFSQVDNSEVIPSYEEGSATELWNITHKGMNSKCRLSAREGKCDRE